MKLMQTKPKHYHRLAMIGALVFVFVFAKLMMPARPVSALDVNVSATVTVMPPPGGGGPPPPPPPIPTLIITNVHVPIIGYTNAEVAWDTNLLATSYIDYGLTTLYELGTVSDTNLVFTRQLPISGLTAATLYHFRVRSTEPGGGSATSVDGTFMTLGLVDTIPPANVSNFTVTNVPNRPALQLDWVNPTDPDLAGVIIRARTDGYPTGPTDGRLVYQGLATSFLDDNLISGTTYFYGNYAYDTSANYASGAFAQGTIPPMQTFTIRVRPEKRIPKTGRWDVDGAVDLRAVGSLTALEAIPVSVPVVGEQIVTTVQVPGMFDTAFKGLGYLRSTIKPFDLQYGSVADFSLGGPKLLLGGDVHVSNDNLVNSLDISTEVNKLNTGFIVTDLNRDGLVNSLDLGILLSNLMKWGEK